MEEGEEEWEVVVVRYWEEELEGVVGEGEEWEEVVEKEVEEERKRVEKVIEIWAPRERGMGTAKTRGGSWVISEEDRGGRGRSSESRLSACR